MIEKSVYYESLSITDDGLYAFECKSLMFKNEGINEVIIDGYISLMPGEILTLSEANFKIKHSFNITFTVTPGKLRVLVSKVKTKL